jgi:RHS repeat-associated protein
MPIQTYLYDPYGNILNVSNDPVNNFTFVGRYGGQKDWDTGLIQFQHRWYDGNTGRWISRDPIGVNAEINVFLYVFSNPINEVDINGLCPIPQWTPTPDYMHEWKLEGDSSYMTYNKLLMLGTYHCNWIDQYGLRKETKVDELIVTIDQALINVMCNDKGKP